MRKFINFDLDCFRLIYKHDVQRTMLEFNLQRSTKPICAELSDNDYSLLAFHFRSESCRVNIAK